MRLDDEKRANGRVGAARGGGDSQSPDEAPARRPWWLGHILTGTLLLLATLLLSLALGWHGLAVQSREWLPTSTLVMLVRHEARNGGPLMLELLRRLSRDEVDEKDFPRVLELCISGDAGAPGGSDRWRRRYARLLPRWQHPGARPWTERERLYEIPARIVASTPPAWPLDAPTGVHLRLFEWWPSETICRMRMELPGVEEALVAVRRPREGGRQTLVVEIPPPPADASVVPLIVHIDRMVYEPTGDDPFAPFDSFELGADDSRWTHTETVEVELVVGPRGRLHELLRPVGGAERQAIMMETFSQGLLRWRGPARRIALWFAPVTTRMDLFDEVAIGVDVELLEGEFTRRHSRIWWIAGERSGDAAWDPAHEDAEAIERLLSLSEDDPELANWRLRITGRPEIAIRAFGASESAAQAMVLPARYWEGQFVLPLTVIDRDDQPPARHWQWIANHADRPTP